MRSAGSDANRLDDRLGRRGQVSVQEVLLLVGPAGEQERLTDGVVARPAGAAEHLVDFERGDRRLDADPVVVAGRVPDDHSPRWQVDPRGERGRGHKDLQGPVPERPLHDPPFGVREGRVVERDTVRKKARQPTDPLRVLLGDDGELLGGQLRTRPLVVAEQREDRARERPGYLLARAPGVHEDEGLAAFLDHRSDQPRYRVAGRGDLAGRKVRERDPAVEVDAQLEGDRPEVARHVAGVEPFRELLRVPDGSGERHNLEIRVGLPGGA